MLVPLVLPKHLWSIETWTPHDLWRCHVVSDIRTLAADPFSPVTCKGGVSTDRTCLSRTSHRCSIEISGIWRPRQHLEHFFIFLKPFLKALPCWKRTPLSGIQLPWRDVPCLRQCLGRCYMSIHMNARIQSFGEYHTRPAVLEMLWLSRLAITIWTLSKSLRS